MEPSYFFIATWILWIGVGLIWLLPQKRALRRRVGNLTNDELIQLARSGDVESQRLRKRGWWYLGVGLAILLPQTLFLQLAKTNI